MSKAYDLKPKSNLATSASHFNNEPEAKSNFGKDSIIQSDVKIHIEKLEGRQRRVLAHIKIPYPLEQVWQVLTEYEAFAEFMPGLTQSRRLEHPSGGVRIEQIRTKNFMGMNVSGRSVFDVEEKFPYSIHYELIEGEMKAFSSHWRLEPWSLSESKAGIDLLYDFFVCPKPILPMKLVEHIFRNDIPAAMLAIRQRVEDIFGSP